ncbi:hypothetical protein FBU59_000419 [Linderina macrospora]|uniref:Uncharacterized protein n=1 Tax=Linderina macrospora TaxID=4868 RepID=A0ACC1JH42_9FUNG|nr:hypothetical protein FBU59_000419 [Linderina macrospora]
MNMLRSSSPSIEIVLDKPELLVRGSFDEATPAVLSGKVLVHMHEPIRVKSLKLVFTGRIDLFLNQALIGGSVTKDQHREILTHTWQFLEPQRPAILWGPEDREFTFDLLIPGDNPETVLTTLGKIRYQLTATLERPSFHVNLTASRDVPIKRGPMPGAPWALALMESIEAAGEWDQQLDYRVSVPTRSLKDGELFHTRFELEPRVKGMKLIAVGVLIKEYTRYYGPSGQALHKFSRVIARNENYLDPSGTCSTMVRRSDDCMDMIDATSVQIPLSVPEAYGGTQYDVMTDLIEIRHRIKFLIKIRDPFMLVHSIFIAVPVSIMPVTARDDTNLLPRYEAALLNPGTIIMRSGTQPPSYDAITSSDDDEISQELTRPIAPAISRQLSVEPRIELNGFPTSLQRTGSQFYLASPDSSPTMSPVDEATVPLEELPSDDIPLALTAEVNKRLSITETSDGSIMLSVPPPLPAATALVDEPAPASVDETSTNPFVNRARARMSAGEMPIAAASSSFPGGSLPAPSTPRSRRASAASSGLALSRLSSNSSSNARPASQSSNASNPISSLHERLSSSKFSEKMRSIFHARGSMSMGGSLDLGRSGYVTPPLPVQSAPMEAVSPMPMPCPGGSIAQPPRAHMTRPSVMGSDFDQFRFPGGNRRNSLGAIRPS